MAVQLIRPAERLGIELSGYSSNASSSSSAAAGGANSSINNSNNNNPTQSFSHSLIINSHPLNNRRTLAPSTSVTTSSGNSATQQALNRALSRISSLEKTIEFLQDQHKVSLKGLHSEIKRLQNLCAGKYMVSGVLLSQKSNSFVIT